MTRKAALTGTALFALLLLLFPQEAQQGAWKGLTMAGRLVIPALFPYFVLTRLTIGLGLAHRLSRLMAPIMEPVFHLRGVCALPLVLGFLGGYPSGAAALADLVRQGDCSPEEARHLLLFCNNSGPGFILGVCGGLLLPVQGALLLLAVHILSALLMGYLLRPEDLPLSARHRICPPPPQPSSRLFVEAVGGALSASLQVSAFLVLFQIWIALLPLLRPSPAIRFLSTGFLELAAGIQQLSLCTQPRLRIPLCGLLLGWGGCSVHCQTMALLEGCQLSLMPYLGAKLGQGLLSAGLLWLAVPLLPEKLTGVSPSAIGGTQPLVQSILLLLLAGGLILLLPKSKKHLAPMVSEGYNRHNSH